MKNVSSLPINLGVIILNVNFPWRHYSEVHPVCLECSGNNNSRWMLCSAAADCAAFHPYKFLFIANFLPFVGALSNLSVAFGAKLFEIFHI